MDTIIDLVEYISQHRTVSKKVDPKVDPEYKIYKRFKDFADRLIKEYTSLLAIYGDALTIVNEKLEIDEAQILSLCFIYKI